MDQVHDQLWISDISDAREVSKDRFDAIVTVCQDSIEDNVPSDVDYHFFCMADGPDNEYGGRHDYEYFSEASETILSHLEEGDVVLVHCHSGVSRSASTSIASLAVYEERTYFEMYGRVRDERPQISPDEILFKHTMRFISNHR